MFYSSCYLLQTDVTLLPTWRCKSLSTYCNTGSERRVNNQIILSVNAGIDKCGFITTLRQQMMFAFLCHLQMDFHPNACEKTKKCHVDTSFEGLEKKITKYSTESSPSISTDTCQGTFSFHTSSDVTLTSCPVLFSSSSPVSPIFMQLLRRMSWFSSLMTESTLLSMWEGRED